MNKNNRMQEHHIIPKSRGGSDTLENIVFVSRKEHEKFHSLYSNKTPIEVIEHTVKVYFNDNWEYVKEAYHRYHHE